MLQAAGQVDSADVAVLATSHHDAEGQSPGYFSGEPRAGPVRLDVNRPTLKSRLRSG